MRTAIIVLVLFIATSSAAASPFSERDILIVQRVVTETSTPAGARKSQILIETRLLDATKARQDIYLGGVKGDSRLHDTKIYLPERHTYASIDHMTGACVIRGEAYFEDQKRLLREHLTGAIPVERPKLIPTGETKIIDGREAVKYTAKSDKRQFTYWFVKDDQLHAAGTLMDRLTSTPAGELGSLQYPDPATFPGFPVRMTIVQHFNGMEVTSHISSRVDLDVDLDLSLFELPDRCRTDG